jgi:formate-dependent nitrite reductase membrane component NrfD
VADIEISIVLFCIAAVGMGYCIYLYIKRHSSAEMIFLREARAL